MKSTDVNSMRVLMAGGGSGGHVIPALAIARELSDSSNAEVRFVGTARGLETRLVPEAGFPLDLIHVGQLKGASLATRGRTMANLPLGVLRCISLLRGFRPNVVVGVGGYASGPAMMAAILLRIPTLAFEPNAVPGLANRLVGKRVSAAAVNFEQTKAYFHNAEVTGIPVRPEFFSIAPKPSTDRQHLLIFGGSQGARILNTAAPAVAARLLARLPNLTVLHQTGPAAEAKTRQLYQQVNADPARYQVIAYLDDMPARFAEADLILCRSGASTMAELGAAGKASVLIPLPTAADDHQRWNAEVFSSVGAATLLLEADLTPNLLQNTLMNLLEKPEQMRAMGATARSFARPEAVRTIAAIARRLAR